MNDNESSALEQGIQHSYSDFQVADMQGYSARRLNCLAGAITANSYLEIGVETGSTFLDVSCQSKTGVDPSFSFDWKSYNGINGVELCQVTSDLFFDELDELVKYDIVFIDGLHTFEQTYRDIIHSMRHSHPHTIFLIDDTVPCDVFSTCRDQEECLRLRANLYHSSDNRWHGDTYKIIPLLAVFNPEYEVVTIIDNGNPQTILWRPRLQTPVDPLRVMQSMWAIQNLAAADYLWFLDNISLYNPLPENEALGKVLGSIAA